MQFAQTRPSAEQGTEMYVLSGQLWHVLQTRSLVRVQGCTCVAVKFGQTVQLAHTRSDVIVSGCNANCMAAQSVAPTHTRSVVSVGAAVSYSSSVQLVTSMHRVSPVVFLKLTPISQ